VQLSALNHTYVILIKAQMDLASTTIHSALALNPIPKAESQLQWLVVHGLVH
jgi:hypothetical protein